MDKTQDIAFDHELLFERLPERHRWVLACTWRARCDLEDWGRGEGLAPETIGCVQGLLASLGGELN